MQWKKHLRRYSMVAIGSLISGMAINTFLIPHQLFSGGVSGVAAVGLIYVKLVEAGVISYGADRIRMWKDPWIDALDEGYQMCQSLIAIGSGGLTGVGLGKGRQKFLYLPEEHNDFIFSIVCEELGYVGEMAMECFVTPQGLLINELAPRVHNSGHWTQNGASISQFELHLRAITDLPLPQPVVNNPSVMINLIGSDANYDWLKLPLVHLHWYDKEVRPGRKVGHLNLTDSDTSRLTATLEALIPLLPPEYASGVIWAQSKFG